MRSLQFRRRGLVLAALLALASYPSPAFPQEIRYLYDALNRLVGVVDQEGNAAEYVYDAVGNILQIKRFTVDPNAAVAITLVSPSKGSVGTPVQLFGKGFSPTPAQNTVTFSAGTTAPVTAATSTSLTTTVPAGAATGLLTVTTPLGTATSPEPFTVLAGFAVDPEQATVLLGKPYSFQATLDGTPITTVTWRVNGIVGGNATLGTISAAGLYTAPSSLPPLSPLLIEAVLTADPARVASAQVTLLPAGAGGVATARLSVGPAQPPASASPLTALSLSVAPAQPSLAANPWVASALSVGPAQPALTANPFPALVVSVSPVPVIMSVGPATGARGSSVSVTLTGAGLATPTTLVALRNGSADSLITVSGLTASPEGTSLTATLTIDSTAPTGGRILQVTVGGQASTPLGTGTNAFTVQ